MFARLSNGGTTAELGANEHSSSAGERKSNSCAPAILLKPNPATRSHRRSPAATSRSPLFVPNLKPQLPPRERILPNPHSLHMARENSLVRTRRPHAPLGPGFPWTRRRKRLRRATSSRDRDLAASGEDQSLALVRRSREFRAHRCPVAGRAGRASRRAAVRNRVPFASSCESGR